MNVARTLLSLVGAAVCAAGLATVVSPGAVAGLPVGDAVALLGNDYLLVAILGAVGVGATLAVAARQSTRGIDQASPPDPEGLPTGNRPGEEFDERVDAWRGMALWVRFGRREAVRERLREAAVRTVARSTGCSPEQARRRVEDGSWTDDPEAADFLADGRGDGTFRTLVAAVLRGEAPVRGRIRRTVLAIDRLDGGDRP